MIRSEHVLAVALFVAPAFVTVGASADTPSAIQKSTADALFADGKKLMEAKDWDAACPKLQESHRLQPGGGVVLALAICHEAQKKYASAWNDYKEAVFFAKRDKRKDREDAAAKKVAELESKLSHLTVRASSEATAQGIVVEIDGVALPSASFGVAIPVDGGKHALVEKADGHVSRTIEIVIGNEGDKKELVLAPLDAAPAAPAPTVTAAPAPVPPAPPTRPQTAASPSRVAPLVVGGIGVVALGIGAYYGVRAISLHGAVRDGCPNDRCTDPGLVTQNDDAWKSATFSNIGFAVGALAIGAAVVLWVTGSAERPTTQVSVGPANVKLEVKW